MKAAFAKRQVYSSGLDYRVYRIVISLRPKKEYYYNYNYIQMGIELCKHIGPTIYCHIILSKQYQTFKTFSNSRN